MVVCGYILNEFQINFLEELKAKIHEKAQFADSK